MNSLKILNTYEQISKEVAIYSTIAFAGLIFIIKNVINRKKVNKEINTKYINTILSRNKLFFQKLSLEIKVEAKTISINLLDDIKTDKLIKMNKYVEDLYLKCEMDQENSEKETEDKKVSSKNEKIFCYLLKNVSQMITHKNNHG